MDNILLDTLVGKKNDYKISRVTIIASLITVIIVTVAATIISASYAREASRVEHLIDNRGNSVTIVEADKGYYDIVRYRAAVSNAFLYAFTHNESSYDGNMNKAREYFSMESIQNIENEYASEERLMKLKVHSLNYTAEIIEMKRDIVIHLNNDGSASGTLRAVQHRSRQNMSIDVLIEATFRINEFTVSDSNPFGAKIYNFSWTEEKMEKE